ncbi:polysaccharide lyase family 8 super-sandwich domain-containing protein [Photobacterium phosphoreum]|uniref:polysaccharide lyase family 8 super-sandwich domain-containing protein n=1 Tax=Photobacterium phosphoreum TaxID=659 RepID=UPI0022B7D04A|nr:polysaccharide lyase family 8 super-sandwich domain-containing protein [Photobacterium phosphoreum]
MRTRYSFNIHRSGDRMAVIKGYNKDVWSSEIYTSDNRYGRYQSHGSVHVMPYGKPANWGHTQAGWDWNRNPGTTTLHLPVNELESPKQSTVMVRSIEGISGSTSLLNRYGLFSFNHVEHAEGGLTGFDDTFRARKYVMASGDELYLVGNNITSNSPDVETTLFQISQRSGASININGKTITAENYTGSLRKGQWIIDDNGVGYYLVDGPSLQISRGEQESRHNKTKAITHGNFSTAWLPHGDRPVNEAYEYVMVMNATPTKMIAVKTSMDNGEYFRTLQSNVNKQVLFSVKDNLYGYTAYSDKGVSYAQGPLRFVNNTAVTLVQEHQNRLEVSISSPELYLNDTVAATPADYRLEFAGEWVLATPSEAISLSAAGGKTVIDISSTFGMASTFILCKPKTDCKVNKPIIPEPDTTPDLDISSSSGGSLNILTLIALMNFGLRRRPYN